jgi:hypothetical protein
MACEFRQQSFPIAGIVKVLGIDPPEGVGGVENRADESDAG